MIRRLSLDAARKLWASKWTWRILAVLVALQMYFVRELIAVFVLFTIGFVVLAIIALVFYLLEQAGERGVAWAEPHARELAPKVVEQGSRVLEKSTKLVEELSKKSFRRPRSETAL